MNNILEVQYQQTGQSKTTDNMGMREMQRKAYELRDAQYLLIKSPPASGKSRALMFIALDKLHHQGIKKVIVAVPERSIGGSFTSTPLTKHGFFANWEVLPQYNLCTSEDNAGTVKQFIEFMHNDASILICTHATLRFAFDKLETKDFNHTLIAIDEFHHVSTEENNRLGEVLRTLMAESNAHIVAMTGSYFRGDAAPVLHPEEENLFEKVTYNYYDQLNGYQHLKSLGMGYHFYQGQYLSAIGEILDSNKKTIIHIPNVNSAESTKDKHREVNMIIDHVGDVMGTTEDGIILVKRRYDSKILKVADLVHDDAKDRDKVVNYLRNITDIDDVDIIIALGMAKEGFDWPYCEHVLTVGYRSSLTEIIQIIGRATRDSENKTHAQFTNLIVQPDAKNDEVNYAVNSMLKAITASLLMEQVLAPNFKFKPRFESDLEPPQKGEIKITGFKLPSDKVAQICERDLNELKAKIFQDDTIQKAIPSGVDPEVINSVLIPKIVQTAYPELTEQEVLELSEYVVVDSVIRSSEISADGDRKLIKMANKFINLDELSIDLIFQINPFQRAYEIISKQVTPTLLKDIQDTIASRKIQMSTEEAILLWPKVKAFYVEHQREPSLGSFDPQEKRLAECIIYLKEQKRKQLHG